MAWAIEYTERAKRRLHKLDRQVSRLILDYMDDRVAVLDDPRKLGKALTGNLKGLWRYRIGDYRVLCTIEEQLVVVVVVEIGHRGDIYR